ncbi:MAG: PQQ-binding-like beta-propeller repeat protein [Pirellulaceae bacterium]
MRDNFALVVPRSAFPLVFVCLISTCLISTRLVSPCHAENWPDFRGPDGQGRSNAQELPVHWSETENIAWKTAIPGRGWSTPVVWENQIWLTTAIEKWPSDDRKAELLKSEKQPGERQVAEEVALHAQCYDLDSGLLIHDIEVFRHQTPAAIHKLNSYASPSPTIEEGRVYCHFGAFGTACLDARSGEVIWRQTLPIQHGVGPGSSPFLYHDLLVIVCDGMDQQFVAALNKYNGEIAWKTNRPPLSGSDGDMHKAYCTPLLVNDGTRDQLVIPGAQWVVSYNPETGDPLWQVHHGRGFSNVPRPVAANGIVYICTGFGTAQLVAIRADGSGDVTETNVLWKVAKKVPTMPSPIIVGDQLYMVDDEGVVSCLDAASGKSLWAGRLGGNFSASPLFADGRLYFSSRNGTTTVMEPSATKLEKIAENALDGQFFASPVPIAGSLILRTDSHLYRIGP